MLTFKVEESKPEILEPIVELTKEVAAQEEASIVEEPVAANEIPLEEPKTEEHVVAQPEPVVSAAESKVEESSAPEVVEPSKVEEPKHEPIEKQKKVPIVEDSKPEASAEKPIHETKSLEPEPLPVVENIPSGAPIIPAEINSESKVVSPEPEVDKEVESKPIIQAEDEVPAPIQKETTPEVIAESSSTEPIAESTPIEEVKAVEAPAETPAPLESKPVSESIVENSTPAESEPVVESKEAEIIPQPEPIKEDVPPKSEELTEVIPVPLESKPDVVEAIPAQELPESAPVETPKVIEEAPKPVTKEVAIPLETVTNHAEMTKPSEPVLETPSAIEEPAPVESSKELPVEETLKSEPTPVIKESEPIVEASSSAQEVVEKSPETFPAPSALTAESSFVSVSQESLDHLHNSKFPIRSASLHLPPNAESELDAVHTAIQQLTQHLATVLPTPAVEPAVAKEVIPEPVTEATPEIQAPVEEVVKSLPQSKPLSASEPVISQVEETPVVIESIPAQTEEIPKPIEPVSAPAEASKPTEPVPTQSEPVSEPITTAEEINPSPVESSQVLVEAELSSAPAETTATETTAIPVETPKAEPQFVSKHAKRGSIFGSIGRVLWPFGGSSKKEESTKASSGTSTPVTVSA